MESAIRAFFGRYAAVFNRALYGEIDMDEAASLYAPEFIAASPQGVMAGKNDDGLKHAMAQGYARYRAIGTREMRLGAVRLSALDDLHCVAHVGWTAVYAREDEPDIAIEFEVHYFVQTLAGEPKVFGWVSGDEEALLREHGIV